MSGRKVRLAVFVSGEGTNFQAIVNHERTHPDWPAEVVLLVSDKPSCKAIQRAQDAGVPVFAPSPKAFADKASYETEILHKLREYQIEWVILAGYMRLIGPTLLRAYEGRMLNIHPSLLPQFPGLRAAEQAMEAGVRETGVTVHFVDDGVDSGRILAQRPVSIDGGMTMDALMERIHEVEHVLYPQVIAQAVLNLM